MGFHVSLKSKHMPKTALPPFSFAFSVKRSQAWFKYVSIFIANRIARKASSYAKIIPKSFIFYKSYFLTGISPSCNQSL